MFAKEHVLPAQREPASLVAGFGVELISLPLSVPRPCGDDLPLDPPQDAGSLRMGSNRGAGAGSYARACAGGSTAADSERESGGLLRLWKHVPPPDVATPLLAKPVQPAPRPAAAAPSGESVFGAPGAPGLGEYDVVSGVYEGGFKTWECSLDLCAYLAAHWGVLGSSSSSSRARDLRIVELGCGGALPAIAALCLGARDDEHATALLAGAPAQAAAGSRAPQPRAQPTGAVAERAGRERAVGEVWVQDYNAEVLRDLTWPNFALNGLSARVADGSVRFLAGDWAACAEHMLQSSLAAPDAGSLGTGEKRERAPKRPRDAADAACAETTATQLGAQALAPGAEPRRFDLVLSADTIYSPSSIARLWALIRQLLEPRGGVALIAAKSYYFGVGGSVAQLKATVEADQSGQAQGLRYSARTVASFADGKSNMREIVRIEATPVAKPS